MKKKKHRGPCPLRSAVSRPSLRLRPAGRRGESHTQDPATVSPQISALASDELSAPKYVFLFIGDGMSYPQIQATADYLGALEDDDYMQAEPSLDDNGGRRTRRPRGPELHEL